MSDWELTIKVEATSFPLIKDLVKSVAKSIERAGTIEGAAVAGSVGVSGGHEGHYYVTYKSPVDAQIAWHQKKIEELEASKKAPPNG